MLDCFWGEKFGGRMKIRFLVFVSVLLGYFGVLRGDSLQDFAQAFNAIATEGVKNFVPHFRWQKLSCWFSSGLQIINVIPEGVELLLKNKEQLPSTDFWKNFVKLFEAIKKNKVPKYTFDKELEPLHIAACPLMACTYGDASCADDFVLRLLGQKPSGFWPNDKHELLLRLKKLIGNASAIDFSKLKPVGGTVDKKRFFVDEKHQSKVATLTLAPYLYRFFEDKQISPSLVPVELTLKKKTEQAMYELVGVVIEEGSGFHWRAVVKNVYGKAPQHWYHADDWRYTNQENQEFYGRVAEGDDYFARWPKSDPDNGYPRLLLYKKK